LRLSFHLFLLNDTAPPVIYPLSLHDALPISGEPKALLQVRDYGPGVPERMLRDIFVPFHRVPNQDGSHWQGAGLGLAIAERVVRSEEHTSELQSRGHLVCRLLLEKKKYTTLS